MPQLPDDKTPVPMGFTPRDKEILITIYHFEGMLADYQLTHLFFNSERRMRARVNGLFRNHYLDRLTRQQRNNYGFMAYFLGEAGIDYLCNLWGILPQELNARQSDERNSLIRRDVWINDLRIAALAAFGQLEGVELIEWINARTFRANYNTVEYTNSKGKKTQSAIQPDAYFHVLNPHNALPHYRFFLELDNGSGINEQFIEDKVRAALTYVDSESYETRFGANAGQWLVVTTDEVRLHKLKRQAEGVGSAAKAFYFTTFEALTTPGAFFTQAVWWRPTQETPSALFTNA